MSKKLIYAVIVLFISALAASGTWAKNEDKGQGARPDKSYHKDQLKDRDGDMEKARNYRDDDDDDDRKNKEKGGKNKKDGKNKKNSEYKQRSEYDSEFDEDSPGLAKQRDKKANQERKELGRGSEQGQQMREEHSRKWWKFWGE
jgi:hypothetical protein